jgi:hypothetical protein
LLAHKTQIGVTGDGTFVTGWIFDQDGTKRVVPGTFSFGHRRKSLPCLRPGEVVDLKVHVLGPDVATLPAASYRIEANLQDLDLRSERATLVLA